MAEGPRSDGAFRSAAQQRRDTIAQRTRTMARYQQHLIDAEVAATRRSLLRLARRSDAVPGYLDLDFLAVADQSTTAHAIVEAALSVAAVGAADLQLASPADRTLRIAASDGFTTEFLSYFASVGIDGPTACAVAAATRRPCLVDHVSSSDIFAATPGLDVLLAAGSRSVYSYPLVSAKGELLGVLSFHARRPLTRQAEAAAVTRSAALALDLVR